MHALYGAVDPKAKRDISAAPARRAARCSAAAAWRLLLPCSTAALFSFERLSFAGHGRAAEGSGRNFAARPPLQQLVR